jgi:hypothetical protein
LAARERSTILRAAMGRRAAPKKNEDGSRLALAIGSAGLTVLGLGLLLYDVAAKVTRPAGWLTLLGGMFGLAAAAIWRAWKNAEWEPAADVVEELPADRRRWIAIGASLALALQLVIPLRYYFGDDRYDERFAWRMFSAVRMHRCGIAASETVRGVETPVRLSQKIHMGWVTTLERNREAVMERYLRFRCEQDGVSSARLVNRCETPDGTAVDPIVRELDCESGEIQREGGLE